MSINKYGGPARDNKSAFTTQCTVTLNGSSSSSSSHHDSAEQLEEQALSRIRGDAYVVNWYGPEDKGNPQNLPLWRKWLITMSVALSVLTTTFASSAFSAAAVVCSKEFGVSVETMVSKINAFP